MWIFYQQCIIFFLILYFQMNIIQTSYVHYLSLTNNINHLTYYSKLKWLYVSSIDSLSIYDQNLTLLQNISLQKSYDYDICKTNPCQCLNNNNDHTDDRTRRSNIIDHNNYNLILYFEKEHEIENQPYLIDCWSLQSGSCIVRNALNLSNIYYEEKSNNDQKFLFNTDSTIPNHIYPFHFKLTKCNNTPIYLFLTSTLKKNFIEIKSDDSTDIFYLQCLEQTQKRTIALRAFVNKSMITTNTVIKNSIMKRQAVDLKNSINRTRTTSNFTSSIISMFSDDHVINTTSSKSFYSEQIPFLNINDYCPEQLSVVRSIYTDFFERESPDKFRIFQDIIYDENDSALYVFTNQQYISKIIRLCEGQISFRHYVELQINCGNDYTLIQKVKLIKFKK